jgi:Zn finger protein HypA/HybF involved in hydrogenase expression
MPTRTSPLWQPSREEFADLVTRSRTITEVLAHFGLQNQGANSRTFHRRIQEENLDIAHLRVGRFLSGARRSPLADALQENSRAQPRHVKRRLIRVGLLREACQLCGLGSTWQGRPLALHLDHINGIRTDNRLENLRLLCPNCHSQTETYAGRNQRRVREARRCKRCGEPQSERSGGRICHRCASLDQRKVIRPNNEILQTQVLSQGFAATGRLYGVSDNAIRKWLLNPESSAI